MRQTGDLSRSAPSGVADVRLGNGPSPDAAGIMDGFYRPESADQMVCLNEKCIVRINVKPNDSGHGLLMSVILRRGRSLCLERTDPIWP